MASAEQPSSSSNPPLSEIEKLKIKIDDLEQEKNELKESKRRLQATGGNKKAIEKIEERIEKKEEAITAKETLLAEILKQQAREHQVETTRNVKAKIDDEFEGLRRQLMSIDEMVNVISLQDGGCFHYKEPFSELFIRDCYKELFDIIFKCYEKKGSKGTIVSGNPGIGKSYFLFYCLFRFIKLNKTIIFESSQEAKSVLYRPNEVPLSFDGKAIDAFQDELRSRSTVYLYDPNKNSPTIVPAFTIIAASPQQETFKEFFKTEGVTKLYMPTWSSDEIQMLPSSLTSAEKTVMYNKYGGIPRYVKNDMKWGPILLQKVDVCDATRVVDSAGHLENFTESHMLLQYVVKDYQVEHVRFASDHIFQLLIKKWESNNNEALNLFFHQTKSTKQLSVARGRVFEVLAHRTLVKGGTFKARSLGTTSSTSSLSAAPIDTHDFEIGALKHNYFNNLNEIDFAQDNNYWEPKSDGLTAIDSLAVINKKIYLFQITINEQHGIKHQGIEDVISVLDVKPNSTTILQLYFVIPDDQFANYPEQRVTNKDGSARQQKVNFVIEQHSLRLSLS